MIKLIECPRDAMQGMADFIPTESKIQYLQQLLKVGFDTIDFGSFVSPKAIPQLRDTDEVLAKLDVRKSKSKLLAIIANTRGAEQAAPYSSISYLGFPLSISETFQQRNTNKSIPEALNALTEIKEVCIKSNKKLVTYVSMGFGNPYGDPYSPDLVSQFVEIMITLGSDIVSLADTIGVAKKEQIGTQFKMLSNAYPQQEIGVHLHSNPATSVEKIKAAYEAGCRRFDGAIYGFGGCPMAEDKLVGNMATEKIVSFLRDKGEDLGINQDEFEKAMMLANKILGKH